MREVEKLTFYELPAGAYRDDSEPVNLVYAGSPSGQVIIAQVRSTGLDFSNRPGNYFAHTVVTDAPPEDLGDDLPIEFWMAPFWRSSPAPGTELPVLNPPLGKGTLDRRTVSAFLSGSEEKAARLAALLTAIDHVLSHDSQVRLAEARSEQVSLWIAAASYLLGPEIARRLTFATYCVYPRQSRLHLVGIMSASRDIHGEPVPWLGLHDQAGVNPLRVSPTSSAMLLSRIDVLDAPELWRRARELSPKRPVSLDAWFPLLACAAIGLGCGLRPDELGPALKWLTADKESLARDQLLELGRQSLTQPIGEVAGRVQGSWRDMMLRLGDEELAADVEDAILKGMLHQLSEGGTVRDSIVFRTGRGKTRARAECEDLISTADAGFALRLLVWARAAEVPLSDLVTVPAGRKVTSALARPEALAGLAEACSAWPELRAVLVSEIGELTPDLQRQALANDAIAVLEPGDFARYPELGERWLMTAAERGWVSRLSALTHIAGFRRSAGRVRVVDNALVQDLWGREPWTVGEARQVLAGLDRRDLNTTAVLERLASALRLVPQAATGQAGEWMAYVAALAAVPHRYLGPELDAEVLRMYEIVSSLAEAEAVKSARNDAVAKLTAIVTHLAELAEAEAPDLQRFVDTQIAWRLVRYPRPGKVLEMAPERLLTLFCDLTLAQSGGDWDAAAAARLFAIYCDLSEGRERKKAEQFEKQVLTRRLPAKLTRQQSTELFFIVDQLKPTGTALLKMWYQEKRNRRLR